VTWVPDTTATVDAFAAPDFLVNTKAEVATTNAITTAKATTNEEAVID
jgi:hypothetical protein